MRCVKRYFAGLSFAMLFIGFAGCREDASWPDQPGPKVVVSFAPIYCFAANVAGPDAIVRTVMSTTGPHEFNPTDVEARLLRRADLFFINGLTLDNSLANSLARGSGNRSLKIVALGEKIPADKLHEMDEHQGHGHAHGHEHGMDPHVWLSPELAIIMTEAIRDELQLADSGKAANYDTRSAEYISTLRRIKSEGVEALKGKKDRKIVTFHESLSYFANAFDLTIEGVVQKKPGVEPNSEELSELLELCRAKHVRLIAVEPQYSTNTSARTILQSLKKLGINDAELVEIDPLETVASDALTPDWYERKMRANIEALSKAMK